MKYDIVLCGVGGQGVLSVTATIAAAALEEGLQVKQSEVHGMSQRGGAVSATLRISDSPIYSPLIAEGQASLLLSMEPLEVLRYVSFLSEAGSVLSAKAPVKNIRTYPEIEKVWQEVKALPRAILIDADQIALHCGSTRTANMVLVGAAARCLPLSQKTLTKVIERLFARKGEATVQMNLKAFHAGYELKI